MSVQTSGFLWGGGDGVSGLVREVGKGKGWVCTLLRV